MSKNQVTTFTKGEIVLFTQGQYSDFHNNGIFRVVCDVDLQHMMTAYLLEHPDQIEEYTHDLEQFMGFLVRQKVIESFDYRSFHLGEYGTFSSELTGKTDK